MPPSPCHQEKVLFHARQGGVVRTLAGRNASKSSSRKGSIFNPSEKKKSIYFEITVCYFLKVTLRSNVLNVCQPNLTLL